MCTPHRKAPSMQQARGDCKLQNQHDHTKVLPAPARPLCHAQALQPPLVTALTKLCIHRARRSFQVLDMLMLAHQQHNLTAWMMSLVPSVPTCWKRALERLARGTASTACSSRRCSRLSSATGWACSSGLLPRHSPRRSTRSRSALRWLLLALAAPLCLSMQAMRTCRVSHTLFSPLCAFASSVFD